LNNMPYWEPPGAGNGQPEVWQPETWSAGGSNQQPQYNDQRLQQEHPFLHSLGKYVSETPILSKSIESANKFLEPLSRYLGRESGVPNFAGGALQGGANSLISLANLPLGLTGQQIPHANLRQYAHDPGAEFDIGEMAGSLAGPIKGYGALNKALPRAGGFLGALREPAIGAGLGYAFGENPEGERGMSALAGGALPMAGSALKGVGNVLGAGKNFAKSVVKGFPAEKAAKGIVESQSKAINKYGKLYDNFFDKVNKAGVVRIDKPKIDISPFLRGATKDESIATKAFFDNPSVFRAHEAQSELGSFIRSIGKPANKAERAAKQSAMKAQKEIKKSIFKELKDAGHEELGRSYQKISSGYRKDVLPYENKLIKEFKGGNLTSSDFLKELANNKQFRAKLAGFHPEVAARHYAMQGAKGLGIAAGAYSPYGAYQMFKPGAEE
jgi:hypothetical protein